MEKEDKNLVDKIKGVLIDTDILIDISRNKIDAVLLFDNLSQKDLSIYISVISAMELIIGARNKQEIKEIENFLAEYKILELSDEISLCAYQFIKTYAKSHGLEIPDALIAASAISNKLSLASNNKKHFSMIKELHLL